MAGHKFDRVCIIGVGLIGGSLALDARDAGLFGHVTGCGRSAKNLKAAKKAGIVDDYTSDPAKAVRGADLVVLATPVAALQDITARIAPALKDGAIVTDVGSVKGAIVNDIEAALGSRAKFVGGHPVAGSEKSGAGAAVKGLFKGRRCILTPTANTDKRALKLVKGLWEAVGMRVEMIDPYRHDLLLAATSHLPHFVAYALVETVLRQNEKDKRALDFAAGGFQDFTRIAGSSTEMWRDIFELNSKAIFEILDQFEGVTRDLRKIIQKRDGKELLKFLERSRKAKKRTVDSGQ